MSSQTSLGTFGRARALLLDADGLLHSGTLCGQSCTADCGASEPFVVYRSPDEGKPRRTCSRCRDSIRAFDGVRVVAYRASIDEDGFDVPPVRGDSA